MVTKSGNQNALILAPFSARKLKQLRQRLRVRYENWMRTRKLQDQQEIIDKLRKHRTSVLIVEADFVFEEVLAVPSLKLVGVCRSSTHQIDISSANQRGILVINTPARNARAVAEHTLGLMLALARKIPKAHQYVTEGNWKNPVEPYLSIRGIELFGRTVGIIGFGSIGQTLAEMVTALGMVCIAYDPLISKPSGLAQMVNLDHLLRESDFICIHAPANHSTANLLDTSEINCMKPTSYLVNMSDWSIVSENALVEALKERRLAGAAMDVFETQPIMPDSPLLSQDNIIFSPHLGGATAETIERHSEMITSDVLRFLDGLRPCNLVNPAIWNNRVR